MIAEKATVMLVDDDEETLDALSELLSAQGFEIAQAHNGREALDMLRSDSLPALILLDLMMPAMSGLEFLEHKSKDPELSLIPVVIISGISIDLPDDLPIIRKPFEPESVLDAVRLHIGMRPRTQSNRFCGA